MIDDIEECSILHVSCLNIACFKISRVDLRFKYHAIFLISHVSTRATGTLLFLAIRDWLFLRMLNIACKYVLEGFHQAIVQSFLKWYMYRQTQIALFNFECLLLGANRLKPRSGPTYVGPDLCSSLYAISQKYWHVYTCISIP